MLPLGHRPWSRLGRPAVKGRPRAHPMPPVADGAARMRGPEVDEPDTAGLALGTLMVSLHLAGVVVLGIGTLP